MAGLYDLFVDWKGRLGREMPGLLARLGAAGARKVLDVGCGTGRHVQALRDAGLDALGADASEEMLAQARAWTGGGDGLFTWRLGEPPPDALAAEAPFDAITCLGNTWPQILEADAVAAGARALHGLLAPGGLLLVGLKAVAVRRESGNPYLPLLRREKDGEPVYFVRFVDFGGDDPDLCDFHMVVVKGKEGALHHRGHHWRVWDPPGLVAAFTDAGFADVAVSATLADPGVAPKTEDVFVHATA